MQYLILKKMTTFIRVLFLSYSIHLCTCNSISELHEKNADDAFNFILKVKHESENIREYITKVQALFCPDQSIRETGNTEESSDVINFLPPELTI